ncbi:unnamed protein product [Gongylonema pulchrum]|uniref:YL1_C domain-containing protein n=1 Tax=Gongylonema pulchrum TaxID=637853 RepID=A0A183CXN2_9BILA|nr:unnamed protein product [Gongylonema pulchrum]
MRADSELNSSETLAYSPVIKRYVYDPGTLTHKEYIIKMHRDGEVPAHEYLDVQSFAATSSPFGKL